MHLLAGPQVACSGATTTAPMESTQDVFSRSWTVKIQSPPMMNGSPAGLQSSTHFGQDRPILLVGADRLHEVQVGNQEAAFDHAVDVVHGRSSRNSFHII
eukprot:7418488-Pyramimonas_sp.AAC.1